MNRNFFSLLPSRSILTLTAASVGMLVLTGCGMGISDVSAPQSTVLPAMSGKVMGGETPVSGAKLILWQTDPAGTGYGTTGAVQLATTTSTTGGTFNFTAGSYTCAAGQFAYVTATGGDVTNGGGTINPNLVLMAALGSCSNFSGTAAENNIRININELSTIAAAYTLSAFTSVNDNGSTGNQLVYISAPANNNNAGTGSCIGTGSSMACTAAGLKHAFANAANLVDAVHFDGSQPAGTANVTVTGNSSGSIPTAVINTLGNIFQFCTNSAGGTAGDSSNCGIFFTNATPTAGTAPANTLSAMINIAHNPFHNVGSGTCTGSTGGLFCLATGFPSFAPALSTSPHDWTIAIAYSGTNLGTFGWPQWVTLDANDNVYVQTSNSFAGTQMGIAAMKSNGQGLWNNPVSANQCNPGTIAADTNGNIFSSVTSGSADTCSWAIYEYSAATGGQTDEFAPGSGKVCNLSTGVTSATCPGFPSGGYDTVHSIQSTPNALALDRLNNLWYGRRSSTCVQCIVELPYSGSYGAATTFEGAAGNDDWDTEFQLLIDPTGNVYTGTAIANVYVAAQTSPATPNSPTYTSGTGVITQALGTVNFGGVSLDSAGNLWTTYASTIAEFTPGFTGGVITSFTPQPTITNTASKPEAGQIDGHGGYWFPSFTTSADIFYQATPSQPGYNPSGQNAYVIQPCYTPASATACATTLSSSDPHQLQIDSTGAMWVAAQGNSAGTVPPFVLQIFGPTYPTWPQLSYGKFGVMPQ